MARFRSLRPGGHPEVAPAYAHSDRQSAEHRRGGLNICGHQLGVSFLTTSAHCPSGRSYRVRLEDVARQREVLALLWNNLADGTIGFLAGTTLRSRDGCH